MPDWRFPGTGASHAVARLLGHAIGGGMTARYIHEGKNSREAMDKLCEFPQGAGNLVVEAGVRPWRVVVFAATCFPRYVCRR